MIVIVEGIDRVGKTTLAKKLEKAGFVYLKDEFILDDGFINNFSDYSLGKCDSFIAIAKKLNEEGKNIVIDRLHFTEIIYGKAKRGQVNQTGCYALDMELANLGAKLFLVLPSNMELTKELAKEDQSDLNELFKFYTSASSMSVVTCTYEDIDKVVGFIIGGTFEYDFYFASPFFNPEQVEREERMINHLRKLGFKVFSPKENCHLDSKASLQSREDVFNENCNAIKSSRAVFAVTDGKDMGTIWEAGFAFGINKPIIYFAETLGGNQFNLMLAQSGVDVFTNQREVTFGSLIDALQGHGRQYRGDIE